jgi:hypothetical protein
VRAKIDVILQREFIENKRMVAARRLNAEDNRRTQVAMLGYKILSTWSVRSR